MERVGQEKAERHHDEFVTEAPSEKVFESFFEVSHEQLDIFRQRVDGSGGHCRVCVHPFFVEQYPSSLRGRGTLSSHAEIVEHMQDAYVRTVASVMKNPRSAPLIVLESVN